jgi:hypothetical protein
MSFDQIESLKQIRAYVRTLPCKCMRPKRLCARCNAEALAARLIRDAKGST